MFSTGGSTDTQLSEQVAADSTPISRHRFPFVLWPIWIVWLPLLIPPAMDLIHAEPGTLYVAVTLIGLAVFVGIYLWGSWHNVYELAVSKTLTSRVRRSQWMIAISLVSLSFILAVLGRVNPNWLDPFIFSSAYISGSLPPRKAIPAIGLVTVLSLIAGRIMGLGLFDVVQTNVIMIVTCVTTLSMVRTVVASRALNLAREELARLAVTNERLRIARDLHDLLGHNLSLIALKSELARRLIEAAPERAAAEIGDVEMVARTTLQEVREAVGQYRQPTLSSELHAAQEILTAAGIEYRYEGAEIEDNKLSPTIETTLSWVIREGVTNVIRHSRAHLCTIRVTYDRKTVAVAISDDGPATPKAASLSETGNGLRGLGERITQLGGHFEFGPQAAGGFGLAVTVPLVPAAHRLPGRPINLPDGQALPTEPDPDIV